MGADTQPIDKPQPSSLPFQTRTVALVGLMGAGKSTVGRRLAVKLGRPFYDSDSEIEKAAGRSVAEIFSTMGEEEFRRGEKAVIKRLVQQPPHVLATGGGAYLDEETRDELRAHAITVWLSADFDTLWKRVSKRGHRPLLRTENPQERLAELLQARKPYYSQADLIVESRDGPHMDTVRSIMKALEAWTAK